MDVQRYRQLVTAGVTFCLLLLSAGCATKKYVQSNLAPLEVKLDNTNKQVAQNSERITDLDKKTEREISQAQSSADAANQLANKAERSALDARGLAQEGISDAAAVKQEVENADNFRSLRKATILFGFYQSELTSEDIGTLDSLAQTVSGMKHYVLEVRGFTDNVGPRQYNLALSRKRADAVVRYLTLNKQIPLVRVYVAGYGEQDPAAPNETRSGREQNRRVDVSVLAPQSSGTTAEAQQGQAPGSDSAQRGSAPPTPIIPQQ